MADISEKSSYETPENLEKKKSKKTVTWLSIFLIIFIILAIIMGLLYWTVATQPEAWLLTDIYLDPEIQSRGLSFAAFQFEQIYNYEDNNGKTLKCPKDYKIKMASVSYEIYDPYRQCYPTGERAFPIDNDGGQPMYNCGPYWLGGVDNEFINATGLTGEGPGNGGCKYDATTEDTTTSDDSSSNGSCWGGGYQCTVQDITAYVAKICDGKNECNISVDSKIGPSPCNFMQTNLDKDTYNSLFPKDYYTANNGDTANFPVSIPSSNNPEQLSGLYVTGTFVCEL